MVAAESSARSAAHTEGRRIALHPSPLFQQAAKL